MPAKTETERIEDAFVVLIEEQMRQWLKVAPDIVAEAIEGPLQDAGIRIDKV